MEQREQRSPALIVWGQYGGGVQTSTCYGATYSTKHTKWHDRQYARDHPTRTVRLDLKARMFMHKCRLKRYVRSIPAACRCASCRLPLRLLPPPLRLLPPAAKLNWRRGFVVSHVVQMRLEGTFETRPLGNIPYFRRQRVLLAWSCHEERSASEAATSPMVVI